MSDKAREAIDSMKMQRVNIKGEGGKTGGFSDSEKCLMIAELSLTKPMKIVFLNKIGSRLL